MSGKRRGRVKAFKQIGRIKLTAVYEVLTDQRIVLIITVTRD